VTKEQTRGSENAGDGRGIDSTLGVLAGEGAEQRVPRQRAGSEGAAPIQVWPKAPGIDGAGGRAGAAARDDAVPTYYDLPVVKQPVWIWAVPAYFYAGGAAGAAAVLGAAAQVADREGLADLIDWSRRIAAGGVAVGTALLVHDLGRPGRFLHMLRVFRPTSPLSVGSWVLAAATPAAVAAAILSRAGGFAGSLGDVAGLGAAALGMPLASYTGVLLGNTVVPLWTAMRRPLPPLFVASGASSAAALLTLPHLSDRSARVVRRFGVVALATELAASRWAEHTASRVERVGRPLRHGVAAVLWRGAEVCAAVGLILSLAPLRRRGLRRTGAVLATAGALAMRFAVHQAGKASSRDPRATFEQQRTGPANTARSRDSTSGALG
jgi:formate-dependent nitrite reductase membrane component NrfD